ERQVPIEGGDGLPHGRLQDGRAALAADEIVHFPQWLLCERHVDERRRRLADPAILRVARDADDGDALDRRLTARAEVAVLEPLSHRILIRPNHSGEALVDDGDTRHAIAIVGTEAPPA